MKNSSAAESSAQQQALIFIPDISGFTQFVTDTEISHAKHIIEELLEILIDANKIGMEISEIEGDAILFYRFGKAPTSSEMLEQVKEMFNNFHLHLKKYETHRICNCGACCTAHNLAIKFIAHYGDITINTVRQYKKLFGKEVIVAHRLLKNNIDSHEYSLFTDNLKETHESWKDIQRHSWTEVESSDHEYDSGKISFSYLSLTPLLDQLPTPRPEDYSMKGLKKKTVEYSRVIDAPLEMVFNVVADVPWRAKWLPGTLEKFTDMNTTLTQTGQTHKCLAKGPVIVSHDYKFSSQAITFTETDQKKTYCVVYTLEKVNDLQTKVTLTCFLKKNILMELFFGLMVKSKMYDAWVQATENLNAYCKHLLEKGEKHPFAIVYEPSTLAA